VQHQEAEDDNQPQKENNALEHLSQKWQFIQSAEVRRGLTKVIVLPQNVESLYNSYAVGIFLQKYYKDSHKTFIPVFFCVNMTPVQRAKYG
jgi:hypothetical protein